MANEARGILFETITHAALQKAAVKAEIRGEVLWNQKPSGMSIRPDFTIGTDKDHPSHLILVTATGAPRNSEMKAWRNLGEMQEVKAQLPTPPTVVSLHYKSGVKRGLSAATQHLYDAVIYVEERSYYQPLTQWVQSNLRNAGRAHRDRLTLLQAAVEEDSRLAGSIEALVADLTEALKQCNKDLEPLWELMREDFLEQHPAVQARKTSVRRGLGKLLVLESHVRELVYTTFSGAALIPTQELPSYVFDLGFFRKTIAGARLYDSEIVAVVNLLGPETCETLLRRAPEAMQPWVNVLRQLGNVSEFLAFIADEYDQIADPDGLYVLLSDCQSDPALFAEEHGIEYTGQLSHNWLFTVLMDTIKASTGKQTGFGYAQLAVEMGRSEDITSGYITIADWANRVPGTDLPSHVLRGVATVLATRIGGIGESQLPRLRSKLIEVTQRSFLEARIIPYRNFEVLLWLLEAELQRQEVTYIPKTSYEGWINEYSGVGRRVATTPFVRVGSSLIHWKTVSDAGKSHKKKELAARARAIRYEYNVERDTFIRREGVNQLVLIVDGTFGDEDLEVLVASGWDIIIYPDDIPELVANLK